MVLRERAAAFLMSVDGNPLRLRLGRLWPLVDADPQDSLV